MSIRISPMGDSAPARSTALLKNRAYEILLARIVSGELAPGDKISERTLGDELHMSKTPIKAALERLEEQGFVTLAPQRSAVVRAMSDKEIADHYQLRSAVERLVVELVAGRLDQQQADLIEQTLLRQREIIDSSPELVGWAEADYDFHLALARAAGNDEVIKIMSLMRDRLSWLVRAIVRRDPSAPMTTIEEHRRIFRHVLAGDVEQAKAAVELHFANGIQFMLEGRVSYGVSDLA